MSVRLSRAIIVLVAVSFVANLVVVSMYLPIAAMPALGLELDPVKDNAVIWKVQEGSPAHQSGLRPGDVIQRIDDFEVSNSADYYLREQLLQPRQPVRLTASRGTEDLKFTLNLKGTFFDSVSAVHAAAILFWMFIAVLELVFAVMLAYGRPRDSSALLAAAFLAVLTTIYSQSAGVSTLVRDLPSLLKISIFPVHFAHYLILFFAFAFCAHFPNPIFRRKLTFALLSGPAILIYLYLLALNHGLYFGTDPNSLFRTSLGQTFHPLQPWLLTIVLLYGAGSIICIVANYRRCDRAERRRMRLMLAGALVGMGSVLPPAALYGLVHSDLIVRSGYVAIVFGGLRLIFLAAFVYAVLKYRVFEIPVLLKRSGRYLMVQRGFMVILLILGVMVTAGFSQSMAQSFPAQAVLAVPLGAAFGIALFWAGSAVHSGVRQRLDRAFFRDVYDARTILEAMAERSREASSRSELAGVLRKHIGDALHPAFMAVFLEREGGKIEFILGNQDSVHTIPHDLPILEKLIRSGKPRELQPIDWDPKELGPLAALKPECMVPILGKNEHLRGLLVMGAKLSEEPYSREDLRLMNAAAVQSGVALDNIAYVEDIAAKLQAERLAAHELDIARTVQGKLLPETPPALQSLECTAKCIQARHVGGDFYDFLEFAPGKVGFVLADISGKGISAALLMSSLQAILRSQSIRTPYQIQSTLTSVNNLFQKSIERGSYATLFFGFYDDLARRLTYANCGHTPPVLLRADGSLERLDPTATVLGAFSDWTCGVSEVNLETGDLLLMFSDGIPEAENRDGEHFGEERLIEVALANRDAATGALSEAVIRSVMEFSGREQQDDITLVVAKARAVAKPTGA